MQKLISISSFRKNYFESGSAPAPTTVRNWLIDGAVKGRIVTGGGSSSYYIDSGAWELATGNSDVDALLASLDQ